MSLKKILAPLRNVVLPVEDECLRLTVRPGRTNPFRILLMRFDFIGDFVLWLDAAKELRRHFQKGKYEITLIGNDLWTDFAASSPNFDHVWPLNRKSFLNNPVYRFSVMKRVREAGFGVAINPTFSREFLVGDSIIHASEAPRRIGWVGDLSNIKPWQKKISDYWYTELVRSSDQSMMELERNAEFIRGLGIASFQASLPELPPLSAQTWIDRKYFVLAPGASWSGRHWSLDSFTSIANKLQKKTGWIPVIVGSSSEIVLGLELEKLLTPEANCKNLVGKTSVSEMLSVIASSSFVFGNETAAVHCAAAARVPSVCVLGGGHFGRFLPYRLASSSDSSHQFYPTALFRKMDCFGCNWNCIYEHPPDAAVPCISAITVDEVWRTIETSLETIHDS